MNVTNRFVVAAAVWGLLSAPDTASAQGIATPRAPQGLFGAVRPDTPAKTKLDVMASVIEGYDDDVPTFLTPTLDPNSLQSGGLFTMMNGTADYSWASKNVDVAGSAATNLRYYRELGETRSVGHNAGVGVTMRAPGRTTLFVNQAMAYAPTYLYDLFPTGAILEPGSTPPTSPNHLVSTKEFYAYLTSLSIGHDFTQRVNLSVDGDYSYTDRQDETPDWRDLASYSWGARYTQGMSQNVSLHGTYRMHTGDFGYAGISKTTEHTFGFGVDVVRRLSATRETSLNVSFGASAADVPLSSDVALTLHRRYFGAGAVGFGYQFGRTWQARADFKRGIEYIVDLPEPVFADGAGVSVAGMLNRRVDLVVLAGYSNGESLINRNGLVYDTYTGNVRVRYAMTRELATFVEYLYYYYDFRGTIELAEGIPQGLERNGIRAGLTLWMPALRR